MNSEEYGLTYEIGVLEIGLFDISNTDFLISKDKDISFKLKYRRALRIMNSKYVGKKLV